MKLQEILVDAHFPKQIRCSAPKLLNPTQQHLPAEFERKLRRLVADA